MHAFEYLRAGGLKQAGDWLRQHPESRPLAGGMTLVPSLKHRLAQVSHLVDVGRLTELRGIDSQGQTLRVGAGMRHAEVAEDAQVRQHLPGLAQLAGQIGDPQVRARGTLGGSVANNDPVADYPAALLALDAVVITDQREIAAADFFLGMFSTALQADELIVAVRFQVPRRSAYAKFRHPASGYAMAGVFVAEHADGQRRVAVTGAADGVFRWSEAEQAWAQGRQPGALRHDGLLDDIHAPARYRAHLASVMLQQALAQLAAEKV
ncbi:MAG: xanthine dehydrogenase family protein subunit M [Alphaproteobacteria bacterium]|nr:xanthine dehydrogenase family protein subunit M [Alphaproteobacteria bacterium]